MISSCAIWFEKEFTLNITLWLAFTKEVAKITNKAFKYCMFLLLNSKMILSK